MIPYRYRLVELDTRCYAIRTRRNVRSSDGTLIVAGHVCSSGTALTARTARRIGKPLFYATNPIGEFIQWINENRITCLNVAGPRASRWPEGYAMTFGWLRFAIELDPPL